MLEPYERGQQDNRLGVPLSGCPYSDGSPEQGEWEAGWIAAEEDHG